MSEVRHCETCAGPLSAPDLAHQCRRCVACRRVSPGRRSYPRHGHKPIKTPWLAWHAKPPAPPPRESWWVGLSREALSAQARARFAVNWLEVED